MEEMVRRDLAIASGIFMSVNIFMVPHCRKRHNRANGYTWGDEYPEVAPRTAAA